MKLKKVIVGLLVCVILIVGFRPFDYDSGDIVNMAKLVQAIEKVKTEISELEEVEVTIKDVVALNDVNKNQNYVMLTFETGYAIITYEGVISEYSMEEGELPFDIEQDHKYYLGPGNYIKDEAQFNEIIANSDLYTQINEINDLIISPDSDDLVERISVSKKWKGLNSSKFKKYEEGKWVNDGIYYPESAGYPGTGICGTIGAATLLSYYDDYVNNIYVPSNIRPRFSKSPGTLITGLFQYIDKGRSGTYPWHVGNGLVNWMKSKNIPAEYRHVRHGAIGTRSMVKAMIDKNRPIMVGLISYLGYNKPNHWVVAYQYTTYSNDKRLYYRCVDNHGDYRKAINSSWALGVVMINR